MVLRITGAFLIVGSLVEIYPTSLSSSLTTLLGSCPWRQEGHLPKIVPVHQKKVPPSTWAHHSLHEKEVTDIEMLNACDC